MFSCLENYYFCVQMNILLLEEETTSKSNNQMKPWELKELSLHVLFLVSQSQHGDFCIYF